MLNLAKSDILALGRLILKATKVTTISHVRPDGDAIGSSLGMYFYLRARGVDVSCVFPSAIPHSMDFLTSGQSILVEEKDPGRTRERILSSDLVIMLDMPAPSRAEKAGETALQNSCPKVLVDHHLNPQKEHFDVVFSETEISSASELLYWILLQMEDIKGDPSRLPLPCCRALLTGMTTDTNNFANSTYPSTMRMAGDLIGVGVDRDEILDAVQRSFGENRLRLQGKLLQEMTVLREGAAIMVLSEETAKEYKLQDGDTEGFVNIPLTIKDVRMSIFAKQDRGKWRVSLRSKKGLSVEPLARECFHGGGHENASGGSILIPDDVPSSKAIPSYIEEVTKKFLSKK